MKTPFAVVCTGGCIAFGLWLFEGSGGVGTLGFASLGPPSVEALERRSLYITSPLDEFGPRNQVRLVVEKDIKVAALMRENHIYTNTIRRQIAETIGLDPRNTSAVDGAYLKAGDVLNLKLTPGSPGEF